MTVTLVTISFNDGKWKVSLGGENSIWVSMEDEEFNEQVKSRKIAFARGDMLRIRYYMKQGVQGGKLHSEYIVTKVLEVKHASEQVMLEFEQK